MRQRGFALLIVLWSLALLALIGTRLTAAGRTETQIAINLRANATAEALADGAVHEAIFHHIDRSERHWPADGLPRSLSVPGASIDVRILPPDEDHPTVAQTHVRGLDGYRHAVHHHYLVALAQDAENRDQVR